MIEILEMAMRWAWGTLLTAIVTAVLTLFWRHGKRWFKGVRKFVRTGRWKSGPRGRLVEAKPPALRLPRLTLEDRVALLLAKMNGRQAPTAGTRYPPQTSTFGEGDDLNLKF